MYVDVGLTPHLRQVRILCSADGSTHTESNTLYRKVKHRARPNSHELPALTALAQHISHSHSGIDEKRPTERCVSVCMHLDLFIVEQVRGARRAVESTSCLYVLCVGPLWVGPCRVLVPCGIFSRNVSRSCSRSRIQATHMRQVKILSIFMYLDRFLFEQVRGVRRGKHKLHTCARYEFSLYVCRGLTRWTSARPSRAESESG